MYDYKNYYTVKEVAQIVFSGALSITTIHNLIDRGTIPCEKFGKRKLILGAWVKEKIERASGNQAGVAV